MAFNSSPHRSIARTGFTLIELVVVMGILVVISSLILASNSRFSGSVLIQNLAYDIGLSVRQAQIYGISVHRFGANTFSAGYGMHFDSASPTTYLLFADVVSNGLYDQGELVETTNIGRGYRISDICVTSSVSLGETCGMSMLDVLYKRPEPDAYIRAGGLPALNERGRIVVASPSGITMSVLVDASGQISVQR